MTAVGRDSVLRPTTALRVLEEIAELREENAKLNRVVDHLLELLKKSERETDLALTETTSEN